MLGKVVQNKLTMERSFETICICRHCDAALNTFVQRQSKTLLDFNFQATLTIFLGPALMCKHISSHRQQTHTNLVMDHESHEV